MWLLVGLAAAMLTVTGGMATRGQRNEVARLEAMRTRDPQDAVVLFALAVHAAAADRRAETLRLLDGVSRAPGGLDPSFARAFSFLHGDAEYERIVSRIRGANPPLVRSVPAFTIAERDLQPEGIAFDARTRALFVGSAKGKIVRVDAAGRVTDFARVATANAHRVVVGLRVDEARRHLWAVVDDPRAFSDPHIEGGSLVQYDIATGVVIGHYGDAPGAFNDVVVAPDGAAYTTNTTEGSVWCARAGTLSRLVPAGSIGDANGIAIAPDGLTLLVAGWHDIHRVDVATGAVRILASPAGVVTGGFDGLYWHDGGLIGIQNGIHPGQIVRLDLDQQQTMITRARVVERYHPDFGGMTTAALDGRSLLFILNTQSRAFDAAGRVKPGTALRDIVIARLRL